jgi:hypothetical protein
MARSFGESVFPPFPFVSRPVQIATNQFNFELWKREPIAPIILKQTFSHWPLFQNLQNCNSDKARLRYLSSTFGNTVVAYTKVPGSDPFMGYDQSGEQNFKYAPESCTLSDFCGLIEATFENPNADIVYARGGANAVRTWKEFSHTIRPLKFLKGMRPNGEGIWLGSGRHISYLHQDAHFNFFVMLAGTKRVLLYPLDAIADLYPTPFYGGIAGTTSSYIRPGAPDPRRFPRFANAAKHARVAILEEGDLLCLPPCWWHYVEAAPGLNLMINTFVWALPPRKENQFEVLMRKAIGTAHHLSGEELLMIRDRLYNRADGRQSVAAKASKVGTVLLRRLSVFLQPDIPTYWQKIARCYYDHYVFRKNGHPVASYPEHHTAWIRKEGLLVERGRKWLRFYRDLLRMMWRRRVVTGIVP